MTQDDAPIKRGPGRPRKVEQGNSAASAGEQVPAAQSAAQAPMDLASYIDHCERLRAADGVVLVALSHPDVTQELIYPGALSGFRLSRGQRSARWSDGSSRSD